MRTDTHDKANSSTFLTFLLRKTQNLNLFYNLFNFILEILFIYDLQGISHLKFDLNKSKYENKTQSKNCAISYTRKDELVQ
jgi:hypothetical protein